MRKGEWRRRKCGRVGRRVYSVCGYLLGVWGMRDRGGGGAIGVKIGFLGGAAWGPCVGLRGRSQDFGTGNGGNETRLAI